jgi:hypothetical protein
MCRLTALVFSVLPVCAAPTWGQVFTCLQSEKLTASDPGVSDAFGSSVAVSGDVAVIGAFTDDCAAGSDCGSAYVFRSNGSSWLQEQKLIASDAASADFFGLAVAVSGDVAVVTALNDDCAAGTLCGSAYVFRFNGLAWMQEQKLVASDADDSDRFGIFVSVNGNVAVVGARAADCAAGADCGAAYVFRYDGSTWDEEQILTALDAAATDRFGSTVSLDGKATLIGSLNDDCDLGSNCGAAFVFKCQDVSCGVTPAVSPAGLAALILLVTVGGAVVFGRGHRPSTPR